MWTSYLSCSINVLPLSELSCCLGYILISLNILPNNYYPTNSFFGLSVENSANLWLNTIHTCVSKAFDFAQKMSKSQSLQLNLIIL